MNNLHISSMFQVFPEEIWEDILGLLEESLDISNLIKAFPELTQLTQGKQCCWLIEDAMPFLFPKYLDVKEMKFCRLVSKWWKKAIDNILETHFDRLPYSRLTKRTITEMHFCYQKLPEIVTNLGSFIQSELIGNKGKSSPVVTNNPFPGRHVFIIVKCDEDDDNEFRQFKGKNYTRAPKKVDLCEAVPILEVYGQHIWHMTVEISSIKNLDGNFVMTKILQPLLQGLSSVPNLKSLEFTRFSVSPLDMRKKLVKEITHFIATSSHPFRLETLELFRVHYGSEYSDIYCSFLTSFVNHDHINKLATCTNIWKPEYGPLFPNLCDLHLRMSGWMYPQPDKVTLQAILNNVRCSPLKKLRINTRGMYADDILEMLTQYQIISLEMHGQVYEYRQKKKSENKKSVSSPRKSFLSLSSSGLLATSQKRTMALSSIVRLRLYLERNCMWFEYLNLLPSLEILSVEIIPGGWFHYYADEWERYINPSNGFYKCLQNFYSHNQNEPENFQFIWDQLPNLRMLTLHKNRRAYKYVRECKSVVFLQ